MEKAHQFEILLLGIIYDPEKKKILIGRRENDPDVPALTWCFPGGRLKNDEEVGEAFKKRIKETTNLEVANLGSVFSKVYPEKKDLFSIYFLCEIRNGDAKAQEDFKELKWVNPEELETNFTTSFHSRLKEYILNLK